jgi:hypothetical protein
MTSGKRCHSRIQALLVFGRLMQLVAATASLTASGGGKIEGVGRSTRVRRQRVACCRWWEVGHQG